MRSKRKNIIILKAAARIVVIGLACVGVVSIVSSVFAGKSADLGDVLAEFNSGKIFANELNAKFSFKRDDGQNITFTDISDEQKKLVIREFVVQKMIVEKAKEQGLDKDLAVQAKLDNVLKEEMLSRVKTSSINPNMLKQQYTNLLKNSEGKEQFRVSHILVTEKSQADKVYKKLKSNKKAFNKLVKEYSLDNATKDKKGDLGVLISGKMIPEFETKLAKMKDGNISKPFKTNFGWHVIKLEERKPLQVGSFEQVAPKIAKGISDLAVKAYVDNLLNDAQIVYKDL